MKLMLVRAVRGRAVIHGLGQDEGDRGAVSEQESEVRIMLRHK